MTSPSLSVIIPVYNAQMFIAEAIQSILNQSFNDFELIIIDDGSTDNSRQIIQSFNDKRINYFKNDANKGIVYTRNRGISESKGEFIGMLDADDVAAPDKFKIQIDFLKKNKEFGMVGSWVKFIDENGNKLNGKWKLPASPETIPSWFLFKNYFLQSAVLYRKNCFNNLSFTKGFDILEDYLIWYQILKKFKARNLPKYLINYRIHKGGVTKKHDDERRDKEKKVFEIMFRDLGIDTTDRELDIHLLIREGAIITNHEVLLEIEKWLLKIVFHNNKNKIYNQALLSKVVLNRWMKVCSNVRIINFQAAKICLASQLYRILLKNIFITGGADNG